MGATLATDEGQAVREIREQIDQPDPALVLFFCSASYDLPRLGAVLRGAFSGLVYGCTSAGQIGPSGYQRGGISAVSLASEELRVTPYSIRPLRHAGEQIAMIGRAVRTSRASSAVGRAFGLLLIDGLSRKEERVASSLHAVLGDIPLIGGSAGDDLRFAATHVFTEGGFAQDAAQLLLFETTLPFRTFKLQHFVPTSLVMVVTAAEPDRRVVTEINGKPAAEEYARLLGRSSSELTASVFSQHPLLLKVGDDHYVRSIQAAGPDGSLGFFCAIDEGLVLRPGRAIDIVETLKEALVVGGRSHEILLGCDCVLRRLEMEQRGIDAGVDALLVRNRVFGFCTYGEQYNGVHANQTFTGVAIGG